MLTQGRDRLQGLVPSWETCRGSCCPGPRPALEAPAALPGSEPVRPGASEKVRLGRGAP